MEEPPKKFFRLAPGREVRLRSAYFITCTGVTKDASGNIVELRATYDPSTRGGDAPDGRRPKATLHWVSAQHAIDCEVRLYDRLFRSENPEESGDFIADLNPDSLRVVEHAKLEPSVHGAQPLTRYQFERVGYFCVDRDSTGEKLVFNRTATLKDTWAKLKSV
jgi:glutaminyl-tRNA synthetase